MSQARKRVEKLLAAVEPLAKKKEDAKRAKEEQRKRVRAIYERFNELLGAASELMTDEERRHVDEAIEQANDLAGPLDDWLDDLADGNSRLPALSAEVMKRLVLTWLSPDRDTASYHPVCTRCGLEYPLRKQPSIMEMMSPPVGQSKMRNPEFFEVCPNCGSPSRSGGMMWSHRIHEREYDWMRLDGYSGRPLC